MCVEGFRHNQELNPTKENGLKREIDYRSGRKPVTIAPMLLKSRQLYKIRREMASKCYIPLLGKFDSFTLLYICGGSSEAER